VAVPFLVKGSEIPGSESLIAGKIVEVETRFGAVRPEESADVKAGPGGFLSIVPTIAGNIMSSLKPPIEIG